MSVIRKIPFIQTLIEDLNDEEKQDLLDAINGSGATINASTKNMPLTHITPVLFQFNEIDSKTGILILSENYRVLIAYHRFQDLLMFKINSDDSYEKVNEYLDINELRRLLEDKEGINVVANPEITGTEAALTGLEIGSTKYKVEQPTEVVANPTLAGTESALEGLQVGNTKYKVGVTGATVVELIFNNVLHAPYYIYMTSTQFNSALERLSEMMSMEVTKENFPTIFASLDNVTKGYLWFVCHMACISYNFDGIQVAKVGQKTVETADDTVFAWVAGLQGGQVVWTEQTNDNLSDATVAING